MSGCIIKVGSPECSLFGGENTLQKRAQLGRRIVSAIRSLEVVASRRLPMYYRYGTASSSGMESISAVLMQMERLKVLRSSPSSTLAGVL